MFVWEIKDCSDCTALLNSMISNLHITDSHIENLRNVIGSVDCKRELVQIFDTIISHHMLKQSKRSETSLIELTAALQYSNVNINSGKLSLMYNMCMKNPSACKPALTYMKTWCETYQKNNKYMSPNFWFEVRVMCMDVYALMHIFSIKKHSIGIFYGGESHASTINKVITKYKGIRIPHPMFIQKIIPGSNLLSITSYTLKDRTMIVIGEDHNKTKLEFSRSFIDSLQERCSIGTETVILVEKHISNNQDHVQTSLMCNMPTMAIHDFRCDTTIEKKHCPRVELIPVDNRHYDLGFLRMEVFEIWDESETFQRVAQKFHESVLADLAMFASNQCDQ